MAPIEKHDPIHDVSAIETGPLSNGESFDSNIRKFGLNQPIANPWHTLIIFAILKKINKIKEYTL